MKSIGGEVSIQPVERIQSKELWGSYAVKRDSIVTRNTERNTGGMLNNKDVNSQEGKRLFHGTLPENVNKISTQGFSRSFAGRNGTAFGKGSYFAVNASYALHFAPLSRKNIRFMFFCRVAVGDYCQGRANDMDPHRNPGHASTPTWTG